MAIIPYKGKTSVSAAAYYCPYIPLQVIKLEQKIKFRFKDIGEKRWLCIAEVPRGMITEFNTWMEEHMPNAWITNARWSKLGPSIKVFEIRGGTKSDQTMMMLKWGH